MDDSNPQPANFPPSAGGPPERPTPPLPPPPPEITIRTMKSDLDSLKESGGSGAAPKPFTPPELKKEWVSPPSPPPLPSEALREGRAPSSTGGPTKITPSEFGLPKGAAAVEAELASIVEEEKSGGSGLIKKMLLWGGVVVIAAGVGFLGYFFVFPILFPPQALPPPPILTTPTPPPVETPAEPEVAAPIHQSLFQSTDAFAEARLSSVDLLSVSNALKKEAQKSLPGGSLAEVSLTTSSGPAQTSSVLSALIPEWAPEKIAGLFEEDFTLALYHDADGVWPAYVLKLKSGASLADGQIAASDVEKSANLSNLFLSSPGSPSAAGFKSGQANGLPSRYLTYSNKGAALNIAWSGDKLVLSTSYNGLKKILTNL